MTLAITPATSDSSFDALLRDIAHMPDLEPESELRAGAPFTSSLTLVRKLGTGGMSTVWEANSAALGRPVAVKILRRRAAQYATHEAAALERLRHPQIVRMHSFGVSDDGDTFIVMQLLDGHSLAHHVRHYGTLSLKQASTLLSQAVDALSHAHALGLLHRDIKPSNIQLVGTFAIDARLIDFGISRDVHWTKDTHILQASRSAGTPGYMSPEQIADPNHIDGRSDMWSLAATVHYALTGNRVHGVADSDLPPSVKTWLARALSPEPRQRFRTPREMASAFQSACAEANRGDPFAKLCAAAVRDPAIERPAATIDTTRRDQLRVAWGVAAFLLWLLVRIM